MRNVDHTHMRELNIALILEYLRRDAPLSRTHLAQLTGLNKATVTSLVRELLESDFVHESGTDVGDIGRPAIRLSLNPRAGYIIGAEIGVDFINVIGTDFSPKVIFQSIQKTVPGAPVDEVMQLLISKIQQASEVCANQVGDKFMGLAVGVPGLVDHSAGVLLFAPNLKWSDVPLKEILQSRFSAPVFIDNEANLATFGEYFFGSAYQHPDILFLSAGIGLGGGILHATHLLRGVNGMAGELGHITMDPQGELCGCGNRGCWETQVSLRALYRYVKTGLQAHPQSLLWDLTGGNVDELNLEMIVLAAHQGDQVALTAFEQVGTYLGIGIASLLNVINPDLVVFGGIMSDAWEFLEPMVMAEIEKRALPWNRKGTQVVLAHHGGDACVMGGIATVYQAIISQPTIG